MSSWILACLLIVLVYVVCLIYKWRIGKHLGHLPTYTFLPLVGHMHLFLGGGKNALYRLNEVSDVADKTNLPFCVWVGMRPALVFCDPKDVKILSTIFIEKAFFYDFMRLCLGNGLVTAPGYIWKKSIKRIGSTFTKDVVNMYQNMFNVQAKNLVEKLKSKVGSAPFDVTPLLSHATMEAICQAALGVSNSIFLIIKIGINGINLTANSKCLTKIIFVYKEVLRKRKQERAALENEINKSVSDNNHELKPRFKAFMDILLDMSKTDDYLSEEQIQTEVGTIIFAGQETVATTLLLCLLIIGIKKEVEEKLHNEMKEVFGDSKRDIHIEDLDRMIYCEAFINEILRLYPPAPVVIREADQDLKLESCTIPKGALCFLSIWGQGRSKRLWGPDAMEFRPERWTETTLPIFAFSSGKRACIGKRYAMQLLKTTLAYCIRELLFTSDAEKMELGCDVLLRIYRGNLMQVQLRDDN